MDTLEKVQEKAVKMVAGLKGADDSEKCAEPGLETLEARRKNQDMALVHKYMAQQSESELFLKTGHERAQTRQTAGGHGLVSQFARTDPRKNSFAVYLYISFAVRSVEQWNKLPENVRASPSGESFQRRLNGHQCCGSGSGIRDPVPF